MATKPTIGYGQGMRFGREHPEPTYRSYSVPGAAVEKATSREFAPQGGKRAQGRPAPLTCELSAGPAGGASVRRLSDWARLKVPGRALEAERSRGLATLADGRAADRAGSPPVRLVESRPLYVSLLSVIGSLRFPWGRGAAAGPALLPAGQGAAGSSSGLNRAVPKEPAGRLIP